MALQNDSHELDVRILRLELTIKLDIKNNRLNEELDRTVKVPFQRNTRLCYLFKPFFFPEVATEVGRWHKNNITVLLNTKTN